MKALLSSHQERLWFIDQFETGNVYPAEPTYHNIPLLLHGRGRLDGTRLAAAWRTLVEERGMTSAAAAGLMSDAVAGA